MNPVALKTIIRGDVKFDGTTLEKYSHDASLFEVVPEVAVFPRDSGDIQKLVRWVIGQNADPSVISSRRGKSSKRSNVGNATSPYKGEDSAAVAPDKISITVRAAGTCMSGGPLNDSIILDVTKYMTRLNQVNFEDKTLIAEPGVMYRDFEERAADEGLMYPAFPASKNICAMGGIVGNNGAGEKSLRYGKAEEYVAQTKVVFSDGNEYIVKPLSRGELDAKMAQGDFEGNLYKSLFDMIQKNYDALQSAKPNVSKNSAGYYLWNVYNKETGIFDLNKLLVGSQGTLGIITEVKMRLVEVEPVSNVLAIYMDRIDRLGELAKLLVSCKPESIESFDDYSLKLAFTFFWDFLKSMGPWKFLKLGIAMIPDGMKILRGGIPKLIVLVEVAGKSDREVKEALEAIEEKVKKEFDFETRIARNSAEADKYWRIRRESFNLLRKHMKGKRTAPFIDDVIVPPEVLPEFLPKIQKMLDDAKITYTIAGHVGNGNFHIIPLMDMHDAKNRELIVNLSDKVYDLVLSYGGSITAEHNDGIVRTPYLEKMYGPFITGLFKFTKTLFDPNNIFNPGKKVGDTKDYLREHIKIEK